MAKVFQGILLAEPISVQDNDMFARLWMHECSRVFADRLCTQADKEEFQKQVCDLLSIKFKVKWGKPEECFGPGQDVLFSNILRLDQEAKYYELVENRTKLDATLEDQLIEYNFDSSSKMDLVFFEDAIQHILRILRILMQPRGNAMLIGLSGSGKQSLTKFSAAILEHGCFQVKLSKNFRPVDFRETLKERMLAAGTAGTHTTFVLNDTQIMHESFLEDVNNILNTGEITNLYTKEDVGLMEEHLTPLLTRKKIPINKDSIYAEYVEQLRDRFHIILCMSPVGEKLRTRCRMFPSLVNCCTLDWFDSWPKEALLSVANQFLARLPEEQVSARERAALAELFPLTHKSVENAADGFFHELRRKTYVTPKSFLDGVQLYLKSLDEVKSKHRTHSERLKSGVQKLKSTYAQIEDLQVKLTDLKPKLDIQNQNA